MIKIREIRPKRGFILKKLLQKVIITPKSYRVMVKNDNKPVLIIKNMYEVLCKTHAKIDNHTDQKQL